MEKTCPIMARLKHRVLKKVEISYSLARKFYIQQYNFEFNK